MPDDQLYPPASWDKFEDICADLFARIWNDNQLIRYGRSGQRQNGVDIWGKENGESSGVQCKGKSIWPPKKLTVREINQEIEKAKKFEPQLTTYIIATISDNDARITDHVNAVSERHAREGLFRVTVYGWRELLRRIDDYPDLKEKHFDILTLRQIKRILPDAVAARVVEKIADIAGASGQVPDFRTNGPDAGLIEAIERDFRGRYERALQRSIFPELQKKDELAQLASEILEMQGTVLSPDLRRTILLRAVRSTAVRGDLDSARRFLAAGQSLPGSEIDAPARARLATAEGEPDEAIRTLRDLTDADSRSVLLSILAKDRGEDQALRWIRENSIASAKLTGFGLFTLCQIHLKRHDVHAAVGILAQATPAQLRELPYLYVLRGTLGFATLLPVPEQASVLSGLPMDVRNAHPILAEPELSIILGAVLDNLNQGLIHVTAVGLPEARRIIESYITWCELLHPTRKEAALARLRRDMDEHVRAVAQIQYAFAYLDGYSSDGLEAYLRRRDQLGGLDDEELRATIVIDLHKNDARGLASLIAAKRQQAERLFGRAEVLSLEIQALAKSGDSISARIVCDDNAGLFDSNQMAMFRAEIAKAEGADPVAEHLRLYESQGTPETLRALVDALVLKKDHGGIAKYAELLFAETGDRRYIGLAAEATLRAGQNREFVRLFEAHPFLRDTSSEFVRQYGWQLFGLGRLREAQHVVEDIQKRLPAERDLQLECAITIETGEWERLADPLTAALDPSRNPDALSLIRAAHLSQASGQGPLFELIAAALAKGHDDPNVLLGAYFLYVEQGLEEERPESHDWFRRALALSGPEGPIQRFEIKDILAQQIEWNEHTRFVSDKLIAGELPLSVAGPVLRTTIVDLVLRNLIRNTALTDVRRRIALPFFSGRRLPQPFGAVNSIALDITALLVLGWLGLLQTVLEAFPQVLLPGGVFAELFEGRRRIRRGQRTRLRKAIEIREAIAKGRIKVLNGPDLAHDALTTEIGFELSALLCEARATSGVVIRPAPVAPIGHPDAGDVDLSAYREQLCDMHGLLKVLSDLNAIDEATEKSAKEYFSLQDKGWSVCATPDPNRPVLLDGLALVYLQHTRLLTAFLRTFPTVLIHMSTEREANTLIEDDQNVGDVFRVIDEIRSAVRQASASGRIVFGARRSTVSENEFDGMQSSLNLISSLGGIDAIVIDDRALNKEPFAADSAGNRCRLLSTLDLIQELRARNVLTEDRYRALRYRLRAGGAMLIPVTVAEVAAAAKRNKQKEAPEFRAIRDSLDLARVSQAPQFPGEMRWLMSYVRATRVGITQIWNEEDDEARARSLASAVFDMRILPADWLACWDGKAPPGWIDAVVCALIAGFVLPIELSGVQKIDAYKQWIGGMALADVRLLAPDHYRRIVAYLRSFILVPWSQAETNAEEADE